MRRTRDSGRLPGLTGGAALLLSTIGAFGVLPPAGPSEAATAGPALTVDADAGRHRISPDVYGMSFADRALVRELGLSVNRWGGNATSRYNWRNNTSNVGADWYFENIAKDESADQFVARDRAAGTRTIVTIPMLGWVAGNSPREHPYACAFKVSKYGAQDAVDPWGPDCGNGVRNGRRLSGNDPRDTSIAVGPRFAGSWVRHLVATHGRASGRGVRFYALDNEPSLWHETHRDIRPRPLTYAGLRDRTVRYASAIKAADGTAKTLGPADWGWCAYFFSPADGCSPGPDQASHGDVALTPWYLRQMRAHHRRTGTRILDYLDQHYYPQAPGVSLAPAGDAATQALRLRSTRTLWDPTYVDESWTTDLALGPVRLIPRMRGWVARNYPGTKLAVNEYNWGGLESLNGALAQADVLGIFGRERLDMAALWSPPSASQPGAYAFRMYRNYDGAGGRFGNVGVRARSADQDRLAVYAAQRTGDGALTVMVVNKTGTDLTSRVAVEGLAPRGAARVFTYSGENLRAIVRGPDARVTAGGTVTGLTHTFPGSSLTLLVLEPA